MEYPVHCMVNKKRTSTKWEYQNEERRTILKIRKEAEVL